MRLLGREDELPLSPGSRRTGGHSAGRSMVAGTRARGDGTDAAGRQVNSVSYSFRTASSNSCESTNEPNFALESSNALLKRSLL